MSKSPLKAIRQFCHEDSCNNPPRGKHGLCNKHRLRWQRHGRLHVIERSKGTGTIRTDGYIQHGTGGKLQYEHRQDFQLKPGEVIHHKDEDRSNNDSNNLQICKDQTEHMEIHRRLNAKKACGHEDWYCCLKCGEHGDPKQMYGYPRGNSIRYVHKMVGGKCV